MSTFMEPPVDPRAAEPAGPGMVGVLRDLAAEPLEAFRLALVEHGVPSAARARVFEALADTLETEAAATTLTQAERDFAVAAGVPESAFTEEAAAANRWYELRSEAADAAQFRRGLLTTQEVAQQLGISADSVRQQAQRGSLYSVGQLGAQKAFPRWQLTSEAPLPGLREILAVMPRDYHPLDVEAVMLEPDESLGGRSPRDWLATGGPTGPVVQLVSGLAYV